MTDQIKPELQTEVKEEWIVPKLIVISVNGDPTISDDGLGDGLFS